MKYRGVYWTVFAPMIQGSIRKRYGSAMAAQAVQNGKQEYRRLLARADDLGPGNPLAMNAYFAYVFAAAWLGCGKAISPDGMADVMTDVLTSPLVKAYFRLTDLNRDEKKWYREMKKYEAWYRKRGADFPATWQVHFDESLHENGSYYYFSCCPICEFCEREGIGELMPALCGTDEVMFRLQRGVLYRKNTIAAGGEVCDYWIFGDRTTNPK